MNKYKIIRINYPEIIAIKRNKWIPFQDEKGIYAIIIKSISKGIRITDPMNGVISKINKLGHK